MDIFPEQLGRTYSLNIDNGGLLETATTDTERVRVRQDLAGLGVMKRRADVSAFITRTAARLIPHVSNPGRARFHFFDAGPLDCLLELAGNRFFGIIHAGSALPRRSVWKRLKPVAETVASEYPLIVVGPSIFDRDIFARQISTLELNGLVATTSAVANTKLIPWWDPQTSDWVRDKDLATRLKSLVFTEDQRPVKVTDLGLPLLEERTTPVRKIHESAALNLPPTAKRILDLLVHWIILQRDDVLGLLTITSSQLSDFLRVLRSRDLIETESFSGSICYYLSDDAISYLSARDRCDASAMLNLLSGARRWDVPDRASRKQLISSRKGSLFRSTLHNRDHDGMVTEALAYMVDELSTNTDWKVIQYLPPRRARLSLTPGRNIGKLRSALRDWRVRSTKRKPIGERKSITVFPDALTYIETGKATLRVALDVEFTATSAAEWQDRLEAHVMHSMMRS